MVAKKILLRDLAYFKTGGDSLGVYLPSSHSEIGQALRDIAATQKPLMILGGGTNSLVLDEMFPGYVLAFRNYKSILATSDHEFEVTAGVTNTEFAEYAFQRGMAGAAWMNFLPGEIGGTVRMNARCYGGEISQIVKKIFAFDRAGVEKIYDGREVFRGYKDTLFMENGEIVSKVLIALQPGKPEDIRKEMDLFRLDREKRGQFLYPTCGCVFKNNYDHEVSVSSGFLLEIADAKRIALGGAEVSAGHANFVYNKGSSSDFILEVTFQMREAVWQKFGVWLEYEMEILGQLDPQNAEKVQEKRASSRTHEQKVSLNSAKAEFKAKLKGSS